MDRGPTQHHACRRERSRPRGLPRAPRRHPALAGAGPRRQPELATRPWAPAGPRPTRGGRRGRGLVAALRPARLERRGRAVAGARRAVGPRPDPRERRRPRGDRRPLDGSPDRRPGRRRPRRCRGLVALAPWFPPGEPVAALQGKDLVVAHGRRDRITSYDASRAFVEQCHGVARSATSPTWAPSATTSCAGSPPGTSWPPRARSGCFPPDPVPRDVSQAGSDRCLLGVRKFPENRLARNETVPYYLLKRNRSVPSARCSNVPHSSRSGRRGADAPARRGRTRAGDPRRDDRHPGRGRLRPADHGRRRGAGQGIEGDALPPLEQQGPAGHRRAHLGEGADDGPRHRHPPRRPARRVLRHGWPDRRSPDRDPRQRHHRDGA